MTHLLEKDTPFIFSKECIEAFVTLKKKLTEAPILVAPDWDLPFEIMRDASDFALARCYIENAPMDSPLQEFGVIIHDKNIENLRVPNHLLRLEESHQGES
ncbi:reverse transcriptase domain-containing protein [Tanacetum coccineum]|uniref:Reverse transcriptase domain-containing protein n=1 Tax=Tanacetum coccineum TaxID=301880 RepID=A0ABQ5HWN5_9ASTR